MKAFLLPAILGDEPQLAALRCALEGRIEFDLLDLPDLDAPAALLSSLQATARVLVEEIGRRQPSGAVALVGFSFGASLALEVAAQLIGKHRAIAFLAVLDGAFRTDELRRSNTELLRLGLSPRGLVSLIRRLFERANNRRRLLMASRARSSKAGSSLAVRQALITDYRCRALNTWTPPACSAPGLLIFSGSLRSENRALWVKLCPNLAVLDVEAKHGDFLKGRSLDLIVQALAERSTWL